MSADIPQGDVMDNDYKSRAGQSEIPVQGDAKPVEDPINAETADSDEQLGEVSNHMASWSRTNWKLAKDDKDAIDESNIIGGRTRGAKPSGGYTEPGDNEGLPGPEDGTSAVTGGRTWASIEWNFLRKCSKLYFSFLEESLEHSVRLSNNRFNKVLIGGG
jgi:Histone chaperone domain CHZ